MLVLLQEVIQSKNWEEKAHKTSQRKTPAISGTPPRKSKKVPLRETRNKIPPRKTKKRNKRKQTKPRINLKKKKRNQSG